MANVSQAALDWVIGPETGISSLTIWEVATGNTVGNLGRFHSPPADPSDLGRCIRLLDTIPHWRLFLPAVAAKYPEWRPLVEHWDELEALYRAECGSGECPALTRAWPNCKGTIPLPPDQQPAEPTARPELPWAARELWEHISLDAKARLCARLLAAENGCAPNGPMVAAKVREFDRRDRLHPAAARRAALSEKNRRNINGDAGKKPGAGKDARKPAAPVSATENGTQTRHLG